MYNAGTPIRFLAAATFLLLVTKHVLMHVHVHCSEWDNLASQHTHPFQTERRQKLIMHMYVFTVFKVIYVCPLYSTKSTDDVALNKK